MRRYERWAVILAVLVVSSVVVVPPADAVTCDPHAHDFYRGGSTNPSPNCAIGYGYDTAANYITGTQRILKGLGYYGGSIDGYWGPLSEGATENFQAARGLTADGVVGPLTWAKLQDEMRICDITAYAYYRAPGESCAGSFRWGVSSEYWYIKTKAGVWQTAFATSGPV
jgi:peptidoglycan hydrolase-like protein with peptidoglycan-binding domain